MIRLHGLALALAVLISSGCAGMNAQREAQRNLAETQVQLSVGYLQQGKLEPALQRIQRALETAPDLSTAHSTAALIYERLGKADLADQHFAKAIALNPEDAAAQNNYGAFLCGRGQTAKAEQFFLRAAGNALYRTPERAYENAGVCALSGGDAAKAEKYFREALRVNPRLPVSLYRMAELSLAQRQFLPARAFLQRYEKETQPSPASLWLGVQIERELGDGEQAMKYAEQLRERFPTSEEAARLQSPETRK